MKIKINVEHQLRLGESSVFQRIGQKTRLLRILRPSRKLLNFLVITASMTYCGKAFHQLAVRLLNAHRSFSQRRLLLYRFLSWTVRSGPLGYASLLKTLFQAHWVCFRMRDFSVHFVFFSLFAAHPLNVALRKR